MFKTWVVHKNIKNPKTFIMSVLILNFDENGKNQRILHTLLSYSYEYNCIDSAKMMKLWSG